MDGFYNRHSVYCAVRTGSLNEIFCLMGLITVLIFFFRTVWYFGWSNTTHEIIYICKDI